MLEVRTHRDERCFRYMCTIEVGTKAIPSYDPNETNDLSNDQLLDSILAGKGRFMPAWQGVINQTDVEALVSYIRLLSH